MESTKSNEIFNQFKKIGPFHYLTGCLLQISILLSYYNIFSLSAHTIMPIFICADSPNFSLSPDNLFSISTHICTDYEICDNSISKIIDYDNSVWNWTLKFQLYCGREYFFKILTSSLFVASIFSALIISVLSDKLGRLFAFKLELTFFLIGYIMIYSEYNLAVIF